MGSEHDSEGASAGEARPGLPEEGERHLLRRAPDRCTWLCREGGQLVVRKRYVGRDWREDVAELGRLSRPRARARREYENLRALAAVGVPVPVPLSCTEEGRSSELSMGFVRHAETLRQRLASCAAPELSCWVEQLVLLVRRLHANGWYHRDLYLEHFLIEELDGGERLVLIDVGRARHADAPRARWFVKDLAALAHSTPGAVPLRVRLRFLHAWLEDRVTDGAARRRWRNAVRRKARRMAAHRPRSGESFAHPAIAELGGAGS